MLSRGLGTVVLSNRPILRRKHVGKGPIQRGQDLLGQFQRIGPVRGQAPLDPNAFQQSQNRQGHDVQVKMGSAVL